MRLWQESGSIMTFILPSEALLAERTMCNNGRISAMQVLYNEGLDA